MILINKNKRLHIEDPLLDIQKTSIFNKQDINNDFTSFFSNTNNKKSKYFNHPLLLTSLITNNNILKIAHHNVISFTNPTKQNQIIQEAHLNNINILDLLNCTKFQKSHLPYEKKSSIFVQFLQFLGQKPPYDFCKKTKT